MNILFIITGLGVGGAERQVIDLADRLSSRGHNITIAYMTGLQQLQPADESVNIISLNMGKKKFESIAGFVRLLKLIKVTQPDVIHSHMVHANILARLTRIFVRIPCLISTAHSKNEGGHLRMLAYRLTDRFSDISTNVGVDAVKCFEELRAVPVGRMISVINGIDCEKFNLNSDRRYALRAKHALGSECKLVLAVGRFVEAKDYSNLLKAFSFLVDDIKNIKLWIAGDGPLLIEMKKIAAKLNIEHNVSFLGIRSDIPELMCMADIYILSSAWEGLPLVIGEAMAAAKVIVATDCGGVSEFLGECGFLVPPGNERLLADALSRALSLSSPQANILRLHARERVTSNFSLDSVVDRWLDVYKNPKKFLKKNT